jgi:putative SOS response-associated peptidase YedK
LFGLADVPGAAPRYNIAPSQPVAVVRLADQGRELVRLRGLVPPWSKDGKLAPINARADSAADKPTFRHAFRKRRCLIPGSGFFEWKATRTKQKQPFAFRMADDRPFAFAGIWEAWPPESGPPLLTCAILTTAANELVRPVHDRMPVILDPRHYGAWIDRDVQEPAELAPMLRPFAADRMRAFPVSPLVNNPKNDDARCIEPA